MCDFSGDHAKVGRLSRALISKLVERTGEGAAAEGYKLHIRPLVLTAVMKKNPRHGFLKQKSSLTVTLYRFFRTVQHPYKAWRGAGLRTEICCSWNGLVSLAEVRSFWFRTGCRGAAEWEQSPDSCDNQRKPPRLPTTAHHIWLLGTFSAHTEQDHLYTSCGPLPLSFLSDSSDRKT